MSQVDRSTQTMRIDITPKLVETAQEHPPSTPTRIGDTTYRGETLRMADPASGYKRLLESIYDAVLVTSSDGRIVDFNSRAIDFFRCSAQELEGTRIVALISGGDESLLEEIHRNLLSHRYTLIEAHCLRKDKTLFPAEVAVDKIDLSNQGQLCFSIRNISVRKRAQEALEEAVAHLEEFDRAKSQFVSNVSHELRTPLTSMIYAVANLMKGVAGPISEPVRRYLEVLDGDCQRLLRTVNDILDLRKIESNTLVLTKSKVPLASMLIRSVESLRGQAARKGIHLSVEAPGSHFVECDTHKIERVILNVVNNAIKFTPDGGVVTVLLRVEGEETSVMCLEVTDTGIGIPPDDLPHVTERYYTVGDQPSGSGLGLAISKEIVELHDGSIRIASPAPGKDCGTSVKICLPVAAPLVAMLVHGEPDTRDRLASALRSRGYGVAYPGAMDAAIEEIEERMPDVIVTDVAVPGFEGLEFILRVKGTKRLSRIPIVVVAPGPVDVAKRQIMANFSIPLLGGDAGEDDVVDAIESLFLE